MGNPVAFQLLINHVLITSSQTSECWKTSAKSELNNLNSGIDSQICYLTLWMIDISLLLNLWRHVTIYRGGGGGGESVFFFFFFFFFFFWGVYFFITCTSTINCALFKWSVTLKNKICSWAYVCRFSCWYCKLYITSLLLLACVSNCLSNKFFLFKKLYLHNDGNFSKAYTFNINVGWRFRILFFFFSLESKRHLIEGLFIADLNFSCALSVVKLYKYIYKFSLHSVQMNHMLLISHSKALIVLCRTMYSFVIKVINLFTYLKLSRMSDHEAFIFFKWQFFFF